MIRDIPSLAFAFVGAILLVTAATACGGGSKSSLPACTHHGNAITPSSPFPQSLPLPEGTVLDSEHREAGGFLVVQGFEPLDLQKAARFLVDELPKAGYRLGEGDSEADEAETEFSGHGVSGRVKVHALPGCEEATQVVIAVVKR